MAELTKTENALCGAVAVIVAVPAMAGALALRGWVLAIVWGWFAVPILGLPSLLTVEAIGIMTVWAALKGSRPDDTYWNSDRTALGKLWSYFAHLALGPLVVLGIGWIVLQFMPAA